MTDVACQTFCNVTAIAAPFKYFGITKGRDCHCGNTLLTTLIPTLPIGAVPNSGNGTENGGSDISQVVWLNGYYPVPVNGPLDTDFSPNGYIGCLPTINLNGEAQLQGPNGTDVALTQQTCLAFCDTQVGAPFKFFGLENGNICRCSNSYDTTTPALNELLSCQVAAGGNGTQAAGGDATLSLWLNAGYPGDIVSLLSVSLCSKTVLCKHELCFDPG